MKKENKKIAVVIYNYIQCLNILPGVEELIRLGHEVDLYCPKTEDKTGFQDLFDDNIKYLKDKGYKVNTKANNTMYKILLEPYEDPDLDIKSKYKIRYRYSQLSAKPNVVYKPYLYLRYDCYLSSGRYGARLINNYTNTEIVSDLKYIDFKKKNYNKNKKVLVYLPTYGKECSIDLILDELNDLRKDYYVITKIHHGTCFLKNEIDRIEKIKNSVDEFYDLHKELKDLLEIADVVLTDNSASVFDALFNNIPVAVFSNDINQNKMGDFNTIQYELYKEGVLPYTNNKDNIKKILKDALSSKIIKKQKEWNEENFYHSKNPLKDFVNIIDKYLNDEIDMQSYLLRKKLRDDYFASFNQYKNVCNELNETKNKINELNQTINKLSSEIYYLNNELNDYRKGKLYKLSTKIYKLKGGKKRNEK